MEGHSTKLAGYFQMPKSRKTKKDSETVRDWVRQRKHDNNAINTKWDPGTDTRTKKKTLVEKKVKSK